MCLKIVDRVHRRSKYTSYTRSILGISRAFWYCEYSQKQYEHYPNPNPRLEFAVPAVQNPEILEAQQGVSATAEAANPALVQARKYVQ